MSQRMIWDAHQGDPEFIKFGCTKGEPILLDAVADVDHNLHYFCYLLLNDSNGLSFQPNMDTDDWVYIVNQSRHPMVALICTIPNGTAPGARLKWYSRWHIQGSGTNANVKLSLSNNGEILYLTFLDNGLLSLRHMVNYQWLSTYGALALLEYPPSRISALSVPEGVSQQLHPIKPISGSPVTYKVSFTCDTSGAPLSYGQGEYTLKAAYNGTSANNSVIQLLSDHGGNGYYEMEPFTYPCGPYARMNVTPMWDLSTGYNGQWWQIRVPSPIRLAKYSLTAARVRWNELQLRWEYSAPRDHVLLGSVDACHWVLLQDVRGVDWNGLKDGKLDVQLVQNIGSASSYQAYVPAFTYYRIVPTYGNGFGNDIPFRLSTMRLFAINTNATAQPDQIVTRSYPPVPFVTLTPNVQGASGGYFYQGISISQARYRLQYGGGTYKVYCSHLMKGDTFIRSHGPIHIMSSVNSPTCFYVSATSELQYTTGAGTDKQYDIDTGEYIGHTHVVVERILSESNSDLWLTIPPISVRGEWVQIDLPEGIVPWKLHLSIRPTEGTPTQVTILASNIMNTSQFYTNWVQLVQATLTQDMLMNGDGNVYEISFPQTSCVFISYRIVFNQIMPNTGPFAACNYVRLISTTSSTDNRRHPPSLIRGGPSQVGFQDGQNISIHVIPSNAGDYIVSGSRPEESSNISLLFSRSSHTYKTQPVYSATSGEYVATDRTSTLVKLPDGTIHHLYGEYVQMYSPVPIEAQEFMIQIPSDDGIHYLPRNIHLLISNDGLSWQELQSWDANGSHIVGNILYYFLTSGDTIQSQWFRWVISSIGTGNGSNNSVGATLKSLYLVSSHKKQLIQNALFDMSTMFTYPPQSISLPSQGSISIMKTNAYGNGIYHVTASTNATSSYKAFHVGDNNGWNSEYSYNVLTGEYKGSEISFGKINSSIDEISFPGEWIQLHIPDRLPVSQLAFRMSGSTVSTLAQQYAPKEWVVLGTSMPTNMVLEGAYNPIFSNSRAILRYTRDTSGQRVNQRGDRVDSSGYVIDRVTHARVQNIGVPYRRFTETYTSSGLHQVQDPTNIQAQGNYILQIDAQGNIFDREGFWINRSGTRLDIDGFPVQDPCGYKIYEFVQLKVPTPLQIFGYAMRPATISPDAIFGPRSWILYGQRDGRIWPGASQSHSQLSQPIWDILDERHNIDWNTNNEVVFTITPTSVAYTNFRLSVKETNGTRCAYVGSLAFLSVNGGVRIPGQTLQASITKVPLEGTYVATSSSSASDGNMAYSIFGGKDGKDCWVSLPSYNEPIWSVIFDSSLHGDEFGKQAQNLVWPPRTGTDSGGLVFSMNGGGNNNVDTFRWVFKSVRQRSVSMQVTNLDLPYSQITTSAIGSLTRLSIGQLSIIHKRVNSAVHVISFDAENGTPIWSNPVGIPGDLSSSNTSLSIASVPYAPLTLMNSLGLQEPDVVLYDNQIQSLCNNAVDLAIGMVPKTTQLSNEVVFMKNTGLFKALGNVSTHALAIRPLQCISQAMYIGFSRNGTLKFLITTSGSESRQETGSIVQWYRPRPTDTEVLSTAFSTSMIPAEYDANLHYATGIPLMVLSVNLRDTHLTTVKISHPFNPFMPVEPSHRLFSIQIVSESQFSDSTAAVLVHLNRISLINDDIPIHGTSFEIFTAVLSKKVQTSGTSGNVALTPFPWKSTGMGLIVSICSNDLALTQKNVIRCTSSEGDIIEVDLQTSGVLLPSSMFTYRQRLGTVSIMFPIIMGPARGSPGMGTYFVPTSFAWLIRATTMNPDTNISTYCTPPVTHISRTYRSFETVNAAPEAVFTIGETSPLLSYNTFVYFDHVNSWSDQMMISNTEQMLTPMIVVDETDNRAHGRIQYANISIPESTSGCFVGIVNVNTGSVRALYTFAGTRSYQENNLGGFRLPALRVLDIRFQKYSNSSEHNVCNVLVTTENHTGKQLDVVNNSDTNVPVAHISALDNNITTSIDPAWVTNDPTPIGVVLSGIFKRYAKMPGVDDLFISLGMQHNDEDNIVLVYSIDIHDIIPDPLFDLTNDQWQLNPYLNAEGQFDSITIDGVYMDFHASKATPLPFHVQNKVIENLATRVCLVSSIRECRLFASSFPLNTLQFTALMGISQDQEPKQVWFAILIDSSGNSITSAVDAFDRKVYYFQSDSGVIISPPLTSSPQAHTPLTARTTTKFEGQAILNCQGSHESHSLPDFSSDESKSRYATFQMIKCPTCIVYRPASASLPEQWSRRVGVTYETHVFTTQAGSPAAIPSWIQLNGNKLTFPVPHLTFLSSATGKHSVPIMDCSSKQFMLSPGSMDLCIATLAAEFMFSPFQKGKMIAEFINTNNSNIHFPGTSIVRLMANNSNLPLMNELWSQMLSIMMGLLIPSRSTVARPELVFPLAFSSIMAQISLTKENEKTEFTWPLCSLSTSLNQLLMKGSILNSGSSLIKGMRSFFTSIDTIPVIIALHNHLKS